MWVLTEHYNEYDQKGDYLISVFDHKPTIEDFNNLPDWNISKEFYQHLMNGGGRIEYEHSWYFLCELKSGELYIHS